MKTRRAKTLDHTMYQRIAIAENMRIVELLTHSTHPEARSLALIILERIKAIDDGAPVDPATPEDSQMMAAFARQNTGQGVS
jgi:hypothetical protein